MRGNDTKSKEVDQYISNQPPETQRALEELRSAIWKAAPKVKEKMNYKITSLALVEGGKRDQQIKIYGDNKQAGF